MRKKVRKLKRKVLKNVGEISQKASIDAKLTYATMLLRYSFEYGVDFKNRVITLTGDISPGIWFDIVDSALNQMEADSKSTVTIRINSGGGDTYEAMAVVGRIQTSRCYIVTEGFGHVMSAATLVLACGDKRKIHKYARFMWHEAAYGIDGRVSEHQHYLQEVKKEEKLWASTMAEMSNREDKFWLKEGVGLDKYFSPEQLLETGAIDEII